MNAGDTFCNNCGARYGRIEIERKSTKVATKEKQGNKTLVVIISILIAAMVICAGVLFWIILGDSAGTYSDSKKAKSTEVQDDDKEKEDEKVSVYSAVKADITWHEANTKAENAGGSLACITSKEEFDKVCAMAQNEGIVVFWVGARRSSSESWSEVKWQSGEKMNYTPWYTNEPTNISEEGNEELYLMVFKVDGVWYFNDAENDVSKVYPGRMGYIVETKE